jgi:hypothetical protein
MDTKKLRTHLSSNLCPNKEVKCPEAGCGCVMRLKELRRHRDEDCVISVKRKALLENAALKKKLEEERKQREFEEMKMKRLRELEQEKKRKLKLLEAEKKRRQEQELREKENPESTTDMETEELYLPISPPQPPMDSNFTICEQCNESVKASQLKLHLIQSCRMRKVLCPNAHCGCDVGMVGVELALLQEHLKSNCLGTLKRDEMIARSKLRLEAVQCVFCGSLDVPLRFLRKHENEECPNRRVPCRNAHLGCTKMNKLSERRLHEHLDEKKSTRWVR